MPDSTAWGLQGQSVDTAPALLEWMITECLRIDGVDPEEITVHRRCALLGLDGVGNAIAGCRAKRAQAARAASSTTSPPSPTLVDQDLLVRKRVEMYAMLARAKEFSDWADFRSVVREWLAGTGSGERYELTEHFRYLITAVMRELDDTSNPRRMF